MQLGEDARDRDAVRDERLAGGALLAVMRALAELVRAREQVGVEPREQLAVQVEARDPSLLHRRSTHNSPASAKLV